MYVVKTYVERKNVKRKTENSGLLNREPQLATPHFCACCTLHVARCAGNGQALQLQTRILPTLSCTPTTRIAATKQRNKGTEGDCHSRLFGHAVNITGEVTKQEGTPRLSPVTHILTPMPLHSGYRGSLSSLGSIGHREFTCVPQKEAC